MTETRREFAKRMAAAWTASVMGGLLTGCGSDAGAGAAAEKILQDRDVRWSKAPCRFCGTGCGVMVGVRDGKVVAVAGDRQNPVNLGLLCAKGYHLPGILYGKDRLTKALIRKNGKLQESSMKEALDLVAARFKDLVEKYGKEAIAVYGSGQWTIQDGYAASKWMRAGVGNNNIEANARLCMASAVTGFLTSFGKDEPMGCYDDFEKGDVFVFWGNNMAEMHPVLFSRIRARKEQIPQVLLVDIATRRTRTTEASDLYLEFKPQTDLAIANAIAHEIVRNGWVNQDFVTKHCAFKKGEENIGYGLRGTAAPDPTTNEQVGFESYKRFLAKYTPEYAAEVSGVDAEKIRQLAALYGAKDKRVVSLWCMGMNQHSRGTWINNLVYNIHLLTGKISEPGNGPFSLTGQPSACGTVREVGTLTHALPGGRRIDNPEHRAFAAKIWDVPVESLPAKPSMHTIAMFRKLAAGELKGILIQVTNPMVTLPDLNFYKKGIAEHKPFIVVCDVYPTATTEIADVILPAAMWVEREACFGNSERRTQQWDKLVNPPGEAMPDSRISIEIAARMGYGRLFPWKTEEDQARGLYEEYRKFTIGVGKDVAAYDDLKRTRGLRWPVVNGRETRWRYREGHDPYVNPGQGYAFYGNHALGDRAVIWERPYQPPAESPDQEYPFWLTTGRVLEHWHTGTMTRRVKELYQAMPEPFVELHPEDAQKLGVSDGASIRIVSRRGELVLPVSVGRRATPQLGLIFIPFFDESKLPNLLTIDAHCPISKQPDYKKCAVRLEKVS
jgi:nitrate reductase NapA